MILFFCDLDNTLIYSYKHEIGSNKRCVELYQGREISFMTEQTYRLLCGIKESVSIVPTTTRTVEQYQRIDLGIGALRYVLACNGGVLLQNGTEDGAWYRQSLALAEPARASLTLGRALMEQDKNRCFEVRSIRDLFLFTKSRDPLESMAYYKECLDMDQVDVYANGIKLYILPKALNKGAALLRLKKQLGADAAAAAGDSVFDVSMLNQADIAAAPKELQGENGMCGHVQCMPGKRMFSEEMLRYVSERI